MKAKLSDHELWRSRIHDAWASFRKEHTHLGRGAEGEDTPRAAREDNPSAALHRG
ncbi:MAG: hypothetical protein HOO96_12560 [Polyangiaceae bacterium]|nr:hypothetical protein [Polyangiaceae bacterium]